MTVHIADRCACVVDLHGIVAVTDEPSVMVALRDAGVVAVEACPAACPRTREAA